ncbi:MAG: zinc-binding dehydrogenase [Acidimicrobiia bacterium]|nr:zinc-binding dehydrogenase [Acidimicrobiia bacterium]
MRALQITAVGSPLMAVTMADPEPGPGEVLVQVGAAGICRSDVHYRSGHRRVPGVPLVPGHEVAGSIVGLGSGVAAERLGQRVCLHYLITCGRCAACRGGAEQFCETGAMIGLDRQGGYAELIVVPAANAIVVPAAVSTEAAAVMMCSTATVLHALRRGAMQRGERVVVLGAGGLGLSAVQVARALGASRVFAVDVNPVKLAAAERHGAVGIDGRGDVVAAVWAAGGADVALELVGIAALVHTAVAVLAPGGRAVAVGITNDEFGLDPFRDLVLSERSIVGSADHLAGEVAEVLAMAAEGRIDAAAAITSRIPLEADAVNAAMDRLEGFGDDIRTVISPGSG